MPLEKNTTEQNANRKNAENGNDCAALENAHRLSNSVVCSRNNYTTKMMISLCYENYVQFNVVNTSTMYLSCFRWHFVHNIFPDTLRHRR